MSSGDELIARRLRGDCVRCGFNSAAFDAALGMLGLYCDDCAKALERERLALKRKGGPNQRQEREAGIANLDRLLSWTKRDAREVWLKCPSCGWTWRAVVLEPASKLTAQDLAGEPCNKCEFAGPLIVSEAEEATRD